jgi:hypothetical protein
LKVKAVLAILLVMVLCSCIAPQPDAPPPTPEEIYLTARMTFNGLLEDYITQKGIVDAETKARWTREIDPWFERAAVALKAWGTALKAGKGAQVEMQAYLELKNQLMRVVLQALAKND